jgi:hypothetical protein
MWIGGGTFALQWFHLVCSKSVKLDLKLKLLVCKYPKHSKIFNFCVIHLSSLELSKFTLYVMYTVLYIYMSSRMWTPLVGSFGNGEKGIRRTHFQHLSVSWKGAGYLARIYQYHQILSRTEWNPFNSRKAMLCRVSLWDLLGAATLPSMRGPGTLW